MGHMEARVVQLLPRTARSSVSRSDARREPQGAIGGACVGALGVALAGSAAALLSCHRCQPTDEVDAPVDAGRVQSPLARVSVVRRSNQAAWSPDQRWFARRESTTVVLADGRDLVEQFVLDALGGQVSSFAFGPETLVVVSLGQSDHGGLRVTFLRTDDWTARAVITRTGRHMSYGFSPDGRLLGSGLEQSARRAMLSG
jgi:hypothetical protein